MKFFQVKTVEETLAIIEQNFSVGREPIEISLMEALGMVLAEDIVAQEQVPDFTRSTVDGYAVQASGTYGASDSMPSFFELTGTIEMGKAADCPLEEGHAQYIPTGGMLPEGADCVVMIEHAEEAGELLNVYRQSAPGENLIRAGDDVNIGDRVITAGQRLRPQELGVLAALGKTHVRVYPQPVVGILSTGDEVVPVEKAVLAPGEVRDINSVAIGAAARQLGAKVIYGGIVKDDFQQFSQKARELYDQVDFLLLSGGSSVGTRDFSVDVLQALGEPGVLVHGVAVKPGKPTIIAKANQKPVMGLPGHPASAVIIFHLFAKPILRLLAGEQTKLDKLRLPARISRNLPSAVGRTDFVRVTVEQREDGLWAVPVFGKSGLISTMVESDGMVEIAANREGIVAGEIVYVQLFR